MSAQLQWAMVDDRPLSVFALLDTKPDDRPKGACPGCGRGTVWKIGEGKVTPHVAHEADAACGESGVSPSETAEHLNAKLHLGELLGATRGAQIVTRCRAGHDHRRPWEVAEWDGVAVEYAIGSVRPDIVLMAHGRAVAAVEILHSHAVDGAKARKLAALGIPWVEVRSEFALAWTGKGALRVHGADAQTHPAGCAQCDAIAARAEEERALRDAVRAAQREKAQREHESMCARLAAQEEQRRAENALRYAQWSREQQTRREREAGELAAREERERAEANARAQRAEDNDRVRRHDYAASRTHWDAVFAEPWARDYMRSVRGE